MATSLHWDGILCIYYLWKPTEGWGLPKLILVWKNYSSHKVFSLHLHMKGGGMAANRRTFAAHLPSWLLCLLGCQTVNTKFSRLIFSVRDKQMINVQTPLYSWWDQYIKLPWPDEVATLLKAGLMNPVEGDVDGRQNERIRRTVVRYLVLSYVLCLRRISSRVRNRCPDMDSLLASCLIRKDEVRPPGLICNF